jgi:histidinol dehydrogenase
VTLRRVSPDAVVALGSDPVDATTRAQAQAIIDAVRGGGEAALLETAVKFGDIKPGECLRACMGQPLRACCRHGSETDARRGRSGVRQPASHSLFVPAAPLTPAVCTTLTRRPHVAPAGEPYVLRRDDMERAYNALPADQQALLQRVAARVRTFAEAQRRSIADVDVRVPGGRAGHTVRTSCSV